jgi:hypothetical protein
MGAILAVQGVFFTVLIHGCLQDTAHTNRGDQSLLFMARMHARPRAAASLHAQQSEKKSAQSAPSTPSTPSPSTPTTVNSQDESGPVPKLVASLEEANDIEKQKL